MQFHIYCQSRGKGERKELNLPRDSLSLKEPQPESSPASSCLQAQSPQIMSYLQTTVISIPFPRGKSPERIFKLQRNATSWSTLNSSSHLKTSSGPSQPPLFLPFRSLIIFRAVMSHLWPNAFLLALIWDKMGVFKRNFSQKLRGTQQFF